MSKLFVIRFLTQENIESGYYETEWAHMQERMLAKFGHELLYISEKDPLFKHIAETDTRWMDSTFGESASHRTDLLRLRFIRYLSEFVNVAYLDTDVFVFQDLLSDSRNKVGVYVNTGTCVLCRRGYGYALDGLIENVARCSYSWKSLRNTDVLYSEWVRFHSYMPELLFSGSLVGHLFGFMKQNMFDYAKLNGQSISVFGRNPISGSHIKKDPLILPIIERFIRSRYGLDSNIPAYGGDIGFVEPVEWC